MRTWDRRLRRIEERLAARAAERLVKLRFGELKRLPQAYRGERHVIVARELPDRNGEQWVEYKEVPGPAPVSSGRLERLRPDQYSLDFDVVFVAPYPEGESTATAAGGSMGRGGR